MLHTKFHISGLSGSEVEDILIYFYAFLWLEPRISARGHFGPWFEVKKNVHKPVSIK